MMMRRYFVIVFMMMSTLVQARFHKVQNSMQLQSLLQKYPYSIVCFAPSKQYENQRLLTEEKKQRKKDFLSMDRLLRAVSDYPDYKELLKNDVGFMMVDTSARSANDTVETYDLYRQMPICMVVQQGSIDTGVPKIRPACVRDLINVLDDVGGDDLQKLLHRRQEEATLDKEESIAQYYALNTGYPWGYGPYWGLGWPSCGWYGCGYGATPYLNFGVSFGGGC
jgi:hypothetical protein